MAAPDAGRQILAEGEGGLELLGIVPPGVLVALMVIAFVAVVLGVVAGWLVIRKVRRGPLARRGRELAQSGLLTVGALALPPGRRELSALGARANAARNDLARQLQGAASAGRYVGDADALGPRLIAEGDRLAAAVRRLTLSGGAAPDGGEVAALTAQAEDYVKRVQPLLDTLRTTSSTAGATVVTENEIDDVVAALRARDDAYRQFMAPQGAPSLPTPARDRPTDGDAVRFGDSA